MTFNILLQIRRWSIKFRNIFFSVRNYRLLHLSFDSHWFVQYMLLECQPQGNIHFKSFQLQTKLPVIKYCNSYGNNITLGFSFFLFPSMKYMLMVLVRLVYITLSANEICVRSVCTSPKYIQCIWTIANWIESVNRGAIRVYTLNNYVLLVGWIVVILFV